MPFVQSQPPVTVIEFPSFRRDADALLEPDDLDDLRTLLAWNPEQGVRIPGTGGVRKLRFRLSHRNTGKRGGARVVYYFHSLDLPLALLAIYAKGEKLDLNPDEKKQIRALVADYVAAQKARRQHDMT